MRSQPTYSAALMVVNEIKAWDWSCRLNRKEEHVKLDLAAYRGNIAGVPRCRSVRCNDDKAGLETKSAMVGPAIFCQFSSCGTFDILLRVLNHQQRAESRQAAHEWPSRLCKMYLHISWGGI
jgi:hypothetical protein